MAAPASAMAGAPPTVKAPMKLSSVAAASDLPDGAPFSSTLTSEFPAAALAPLMSCAYRGSFWSPKKAMRIAGFGPGDASFVKGLRGSLAHAKRTRQATRAPARRVGMRFRPLVIRLPGSEIRAF